MQPPFVSDHPPTRPNMSPPLTADEEGRVVSLTLRNDGLVGEIPGELGSLAKLEYLFFSNNQLTGEIPAELGSLANLVSLTFAGNQLTGEIPAELSGLANLLEMRLSNNRLTGEIPAELGTLANLTSLYLAGNQLTGCIPEGLREVSDNDIARLGLPDCGSGCRITLSSDRSTSGQWTSGCDSETQEGSYARFYSFTLTQESRVTLTLESNEADTYLYLRQGDATSGTALHENDNHQGSTSRSRIQATLPAGSYTVEATTNIARETGSFSLTIYRQPVGQAHAGDKAVLTAFFDATGGPDWVNNAGWKSVAPLGQWYGVTVDAEGRVVSLRLRDNGLVGEIPVELSSLANLTWLRLYGNQLTGEIPEELGSLANLTGLSLGGNQLTGEIPVELGSLANLKSLNLSSNQLTGEIPVELGSLANLTQLKFWGNELTGEIPAELGSLPNLTQLSLSYNQLAGEIPAELGSLANLTQLSLSYNQLTGEILAELGSLPNLEILSLSGNQLSGEILAELGSLANLARLSLSNNQLTGCIPEGLREVSTNDIDQLGLPDCA